MTVIDTLNFSIIKFINTIYITKIYDGYIFEINFKYSSITIYEYDSKSATYSIIRKTEFSK